MDEQLVEAMTDGLCALAMATRHLGKAGSQSEIKADEAAREKANECDLKTPDGLIEALRIVGERLDAMIERGLKFLNYSPRLVKEAMEKIKNCQSAGAETR